MTSRPSVTSCRVCNRIRWLKSKVETSGVNATKVRESLLMETRVLYARLTVEVLRTDFHADPDVSDTPITIQLISLVIRFRTSSLSSTAVSG